MKISLIQVPYRLGQADVGRAKGPACYIKAGADSRLSKQGHEVNVKTISNVPFDDELSAITDVNIRLADIVRDSVNNGYFPLVLSGDCNACLGTIAGLDSSVGIVWFDAHGDFNTPETTITGYFDGMPLAIATGRCYEDMRIKIGFDPIPESHVSLLGAHDLDPKEKTELEKSEINVITASELNNETLIKSIRNLQSKVRDVYLHLDIDVIDQKEAPGVDYRCQNGLFAEEVKSAIQTISKYLRIKAALIATYNPDRDEDNKTLEICLTLLNTIADAASRKI